MHETECLEKMYLAGEVVAEVEEVDIAHTQAADSSVMNSDPPDRGVGEAGQEEDIVHKALPADHTVHSSQRHWGMWERSVPAEEAEDRDHKQLTRSVAADIEYSVVGSGRIGAVAVAGAVGAGAEATMTGTAQDRVVEVDVADDVADALTGEGELGSGGVGVGVGADGGRVRERDAGAEVVVHT